MDTMRDRLINRRKELLKPTETEIFEANCFVNEALEEFYKKQVDDNPQIKVCAVALKYDGERYYQIIPWDCETGKYICKGESKIHKKLINLIIMFACIKGIVPYSKEEAEEYGIAIKDQEVNDLEEKWGWKKPKKCQKKKKDSTKKESEEEEELKPKEEPTDWYFLLDVKIQRESAKEPQKRMG